MMGILTGMLEKRSGVANPEKWLTDFFGGRESHSGTVVNETSALSSTAVYACIRLLADTIASLPLPLYKRLNPRGKERAYNHPEYSLLHDKANSEMTSFIWRETIMGHVLSWGNGYSYIEWGNDGYAKGLWPLRPDKTWPERDDVTKKLIYKTIINGKPFTISNQDMLHIPGLGFDGIKGYSPITLAREAIGLSLATEEFGARYFGSGTHPGAVVTRPLEAPGLEDQKSVENLRNYLTDAYGGLGKSHRLMLLEEGMDIKNIGIPPEDSQFLETRQFQVTEIARFFGVQPHLIADLKESTNNNIEHQGIEFVIYSLRPWLVRWEQILNDKLLTEKERKKYFCEFLVDGLLRGDIKSRSEALQTQRRNGVINANDWAEIENRNPLPGEIGDIYIVEANMQSLDYLIENPGGTQPSKPDSNSIKRIENLERHTTDIDGKIIDITESHRSNKKNQNEWQDKHEESHQNNLDVERKKDKAHNKKFADIEENIKNNKESQGIEMDSIKNEGLERSKETEESFNRQQVINESNSVEFSNVKQNEQDIQEYMQHIKDEFKDIQRNVQQQENPEYMQQNSLEKAYERLFFDAFDRIFKREIGGFDGKIGSPDVDNWLEKHYESIPEYMENSLYSLILSYKEAQNIMILPDFETKIKEFLMDFSQKYAQKSIEILKNVDKMPEKWFDRINEAIKELMDYATRKTTEKRE
jgi:HK97 family phage portal protein